ncbi:hypothetical protein [Lysobacter sp. FW306-1B-D06B]|uniref:hypothetical protein n=1 Tax=Lysobacter sp. FW306-1B-D06B TaxID=3140250 RepID=UPI0031407FA5
MKVSRIIASTPQRSAKDTWTRIIELITGAGSKDTQQLEAARSVLEAVIGEEYPTDHPIVVWGAGPRLVIYLRYDADAIERGHSVDALSWNPTDGDWRISAPAAAEDVAWMTAALGTGRISVRKLGDEVGDDKAATGTAGALAIDWTVLG